MNTGPGMQVYVLFAPVGITPKFQPNTEMAVDVAWALMEDLVFAGKVARAEDSCFCGIRLETTYPLERREVRGSAWNPEFPASDVGGAPYWMPQGALGRCARSG